MNYLPSQRFFIVFLFALALIGGSVWYFKEDTASERESMGADRKTLTANAPQATNADYDKDGLKDWEEALWKTDPKSPDTDGDGTPDGEEAASKRNPTIRGPNDIMSDNQSAGDFLYPQNDEKQGNLTEQFTRAFSNTVGPRVLGGQGKLSASDMAGIATYLPSKESILDSVPHVKVSDLIVSENNDPAHVKEYFSGVFAVYEKRLLKFKPDEDLEILQRALTSEKFGELVKLDHEIAALEQSFWEVKNIPVPRGYENFAIRELNYLLKSRRMTEIIRNADTDPLLAMAALEPRINLGVEFVVFRRDIGKFLADKGIAYSGERWGVMFQ